MLTDEENRAGGGVIQVESADEFAQGVSHLPGARRPNDGADGGFDAVGWTDPIRK